MICSRADENKIKPGLKSIRLMSPSPAELPLQPASDTSAGLAAAKENISFVIQRSESQHKEMNISYLEYASKETSCLRNRKINARAEVVSCYQGLRNICRLSRLTAKRKETHGECFAIIFQCLRRLPDGSLR
jgi:hypothetical protein